MELLIFYCPFLSLIREKVLLKKGNKVFDFFLAVLSLALLLPGHKVAARAGEINLPKCIREGTWRKHNFVKSEPQTSCEVACQNVSSAWDSGMPQGPQPSSSILVFTVPDINETSPQTYPGFAQVMESRKGPPGSRDVTMTVGRLSVQ